MGAAPYGRALRDFHHDRQDEPLLARDGDDAVEHPVERFYFEPVGADDRVVATLAGRRAAAHEDRLAGPLLDIGAGVGRHALYFQDRVETVALEASEHLVATMRDRGVADPRLGDMFDLPGTLEADGFRTVVAYGTQVQLAASRGALAAFLGDLAAVTTSDATALLHGYEPSLVDPELLGYRSVPEPDLAFRTFHFAYEGEVGPTLLFRLFGRDRLRDAVADTAWRVERAPLLPDEDPNQWLAVLVKS